MESDEDNNLSLIDENQNPKKIEKIWNTGKIQFLINAVIEQDEEYSNGMKTLVWMKISKQFSEIGEDISHKTVEIKWRSLMKTYKAIKANNGTSGARRRSWEFYNLLNSFMGKKPEIIPVAKCGTLCGLKVNMEPSNCEAVDGPVKQKSRICNDKERRYKEKMERLDKFNQLFEKMINKM